MVHALNEIHGALAQDGFLIDLRPLLGAWPVEVSWSNGFREAGRATDLPEPLEDDMAANTAMRALGSSGHFHMEQADEFPFFYYWDTPKEMESYIEEEWNDVIRIEAAVWSDLRTLWASANAEARVRLRMKLLITSYRKRIR